MENCCLQHSGHESRIKSNEDAVKVVAHNADAAHRRLDGMKNWVIAGMTALVLQLLLHVFTLVSKTTATPGQ